MTVSANSRRREYQGNGVTQVFNGPMAYAASHVKAFIVVGEVATPVPSGSYDVERLGAELGTRITMHAAPASGQTLLLLRTMPYTQDVDITNQGAFHADTIEKGFDAIAMQVQQMGDAVVRSLQISDTFVGPLPDMVLPQPDGGKLIGWTNDGKGLQNIDPSGPGDLRLRTDLNDPTEGGRLVAYLPAGAGAVPRNTRDRLRDEVNVRDYGAIGNGGGDDSAAFTAALTVAAAQGQSVRVPRGTYRVSGVVFPASGGTLVGDAAILQAVAGSTATAMFLASGGYVGVSGLAFDGRASQVAGNVQALNLSGTTHAKIESCFFTNFINRVVVLNETANFTRVIGNAFYNTGTTANCNCIETRGSDTLIANNTFRNIGDGHCIRVGGSGAGAFRTNIIGNVCNNTQHVWVTCELNTHEVNIVGNIVENTEQAIKCENDEVNVTDINISGNVFRNVYATTAFNLQTKNVRFNDNKVLGCAGSPYFGSEFQCSNNVFINSGDTTRACISQAAQASGGIVMGNTIINPGYEGIRVSGDAVVSGNRIKGVVAPNNAINSSGANTTITGNVIDGGGQGVGLASASAYNIIVNNVFRNLSGEPIGYSAAQLASSNFFTNLVGENIVDDVKVPTDVWIERIAGDAVKVTRGARRLIVDTEGSAATDNLANINGGIDGQVITVYSTNDSRDVVILGTGNIRPASAFTLGTALSTITLQKRATLWIEISRTTI